MNIINSAFHSDDSIPLRPLMIGCSGGAGHNSAIQGLYHYLQTRFGGRIEFPNHTPTLQSSNPYQLLKTKIEAGVYLSNNPITARAFRTLVGRFFPILPKKEALETELAALKSKEAPFMTQGRFYVDMLLDVFPSGYESASIWNILQRNDAVDELKKLIDGQCYVDLVNHKEAYTFYYNKLHEALLNGTPYTEIISTQAMALPALCDAVIKYNIFIANNPQYNAKKLVIHEYVIELPTSGAVYYFSGLSRLNSEQQEQMKLYAVNMNEEFVHHFSPHKQNFSGLYEIPQNNNPLVRQGFTNPDYDNSGNFDKSCTIKLADKLEFIIEPDEQIASIMLGSQAGNDTVEYIESLLRTGMEKIFVFGGQNPNLSDRINSIIENNPQYAHKIIKLGNQGDKEIAALMTRSNVLVIRAGALSTQEQLAMKHNPLQSVFIHHHDTTNQNLTSGLPWEDANADELIAYLKNQNVHTDKIATDRADRYFAEARLIAFIKKQIQHKSKTIWDSQLIAQYVRTIQNNQLAAMVHDLSTSKNTSIIYAAIEKRLQAFEAPMNANIKSLLQICITGQEHILSQIRNELTESNELVSTIDILKTAEQCDHHSKCFTLYKSHCALSSLLETLNAPSKNPSQRLHAFKEQYESKEIKSALLDSKDNFLMWLLKKIELYLVKIFPSISAYFTFEQRIDLKLAEIANETNSEHLEYSNNYCHF